MKRLIGLVIVVALLPVSARAQAVEVEWDHAVDFSRFRTYTFAPAAYSIRDRVANADLGLALAEELDGKDLKFVAAESKTYDVFVAYNAQLVSDPQNASRRSVAITVRIFDSRTNNQVWMAGGKVLLGSNDSENYSNVRQILRDMFQKYPPPN